jgi:hypothetical protein
MYLSNNRTENLCCRKREYYLKLKEVKTSMYCTKCGAQNPEEGNFCHSCGSPLTQIPIASVPAPINAPRNTLPPVQAIVGVPRTSGMAIASLILGITGVSILAVIFGGIALNQMGKDPNLSGKGMAIAGLVLGIVGSLIFIISIIGLVVSEPGMRKELLIFSWG